MRCRQLAALFCPAERRLQWEARCHAAYRQHGMMPAFAGMMSCRQLTALYLAAGSGRRKSGAGRSPGTASGGGRGGIPAGMPQGTPGGVPAYRQPTGRRHFSAAGSGGIPAPPTGAASTWGPVFGDADGRPWLSAPWRFPAAGAVPAFAGMVWCRLLAACAAGPIGPAGTVPGNCPARHGAAFWQHLPPPEMVPPIGGTVLGGGRMSRRPIGRRKGGGVVYRWAFRPGGVFGPAFWPAGVGPA